MEMAPSKRKLSHLETIMTMLRKTDFLKNRKELLTTEDVKDIARKFKFIECT